tara:strand:+ start:425 stop:1288 length:864 start_codon:yes stop_codon:yes gene_type:complete
MSSEVFLSTGGFKNVKANKTIINYKKKNIFNIELSGGIYDKDINKNLLSFKKKNPNIKFLIHNYFPPPKKPFVLNLASFNKNIEKLTINHYFKSIKLCRKLNIDIYSFHAGFRIDPKPKELGKKFKNNKLNDRAKTLKKFSENLKKICIYAKKNKVNVLIENNVITKKNLKSFKDDPFLLSHPKEIKEFFNKFPYKIGLLLDVAHLKVSSRSLNFNLKKSHESLKKYIKAYHLSDNNFIVDSNEAITHKSWFLKSLKKKLNYYTIEVYKKDLNKLKQQVDLVKKYLK